MRAKSILVGTLLALLPILASCELCEESERKIKSMKGQIRVIEAENRLLKQRLAKLQKKVDEAKNKIEQLIADAGAAEIEKQKEIEAAIATTLAEIRERKIERIEAKAREREQARERARQERLEKLEARKSRLRESRE